MASLTEKLSETAPTWGRAVAPIAEWVAQSFWSSKSANTPQALPTRLTQCRRSEGRGKRFEVRTNPVPRRTKICKVCGAEGIQNRYRRSCALEVSREVLTQPALLNHAKPKTARVRERISKALSDHAVANTWWDPSKLPSWLDEEFYTQRIQPRLRMIKIREISEAMHASRPYAALVRAGRRRPHPRHWLRLSQLVGLAPNVGV